MPQPKEPEFEASADMRLVELQRSELGIAAPKRGAWESHTMTEGGTVEVEPPQQLNSAVLSVEATATPPSGVIPGAIVTLGMSIANEGALAARNVCAGAPLPGGATYRNGSFVRDGRPQLDDAADEFFGTGALVGTIAPATRVTFLWKIGVRLGNKPLVIASAVTGEETAVVGAQPVIISRKAETQTGFASEVQRFDRALNDEPATSTEELPIYELDEEETIEYEAAQSALAPLDFARGPSIPQNDRVEYQPGIEPPLQPVPPPDQPGEPLPPPSQPAPVPNPGAPEPEPYIPEPPEQPPDVEPAAREAVVLYGRMDRPSIAYFERIFTGSKAPTLLNHFILGGALACTRSFDGEDVAGLKAHMDAQGQLLQRIVLHEKIGKKEPIAEYAGKMLARVDQFVAAPVQQTPMPDDPNAVILDVELETPTL